jgi:hypothetical protein
MVNRRCMNADVLCTTVSVLAKFRTDCYLIQVLRTKETAHLHTPTHTTHAHTCVGTEDKVEKKKKRNERSVLFFHFFVFYAESPRSLTVPASCG